MLTQVKVAGWLYIVLSVFSLVSALCIAALVFGGGLISGDDTAITTTGIVALSIVGLSIFFAIPGLIAGIGLLNLKNWARILAMVLAVLSLPAFPLGTALGIYVLFVLFNDDTRLLFENPTINN